jgi:hypothetical protein
LTVFEKMEHEAVMREVLNIRHSTGGKKCLPDGIPIGHPKYVFKIDRG